MLATPLAPFVSVSAHAAAPAPLAATAVSATKTDSFNDPDGDGKAEPGDTITYDVKVTNSGGTDANGVHFADTIDANTALVPGSLRVSPLAFADSYNSTKGTPLSVPAPGVLANDTGTPAPSAQAIAGGATSQGGSVTLNADGSFNYTPPAGFQGADTFSYTVSNGLLPNDSATVTVNVDDGPAVTTTTPAGGASGVAQNANITVNFSEPVNATTGSFSVQCPAGSPQAFTLSASPSASFTLDPVADLPAGGNCSVTVFAAGITDADSFDPPDQMAADYTFSFGVRPLAVDDMRSATGNVRIDTATTGYSVLANDQAPGAVISAFDTTSAHGGAVTMNTTTGTFTYDPPRGFNGTDSFNYTLTNGGGSDTGTVVLTVTDLVWFVNGNAAANGDGRLSSPYNCLTGAGCFSAANDGAGSNPGPGDAVFLYSSAAPYAGGLTLLSGQKLIGQGAASPVGALAAISFAPDSAGVPPTGGANPVITTTAPATAGITLAQDNSLHGLSVVDTTGTGVGGTNFGTLTVSENVVLSNTATAGTPLVLDTGTLAASFKSISAGNATAAPDPANGIVLKNTGGSFAVEGDGASTAPGGNGSGGIIQGTAGADNTTGGVGVYLENASGVTLRRMRIRDNPNFGVRGKNVSGFALEYSTVDGDNGTSNTADADPFENGEDAIRFSQLTGSASITGSLVSGGYEDTIRVSNDSGTLDRLTISNSTIGGRTNNGPAMDDALFFHAHGTAVMKLTVTGSTFTTARGDLVNPVATGSSTMDFVFRGNSVGNNHPNVVPGGGDTQVASSTSGSFTYDISCNKFVNGTGQSHGLLVFKAAGSTGSMSGTIFNNTVGLAGVPGSGSGPGANGIEVDVQGAGSGTVLIKNNVIRNYDTAGIWLLAIDGSSTMNATVVGNVTAEPGDFAFAGLFASVGGAAGDTNKLNARIGGAGAEQNDFTAGDPADFADVFLSQDGVTQLNLARGASAASSPEQVVQDNNAGPLTVFASGAVTPANIVVAQPVPVDQTCSPVASLDAAPRANGELLASILGGRDFVEVASLGDAARYAVSRSMPKARANFDAAKAPAAGSAVAGHARQPGAAKASAAPRALGAAPFSGETVTANVGTLPAGKSVRIQFQVTVNNPFPGNQVSNQGTVSGDNFAAVQTDDPAAGGSADPTVTPILTPPSISVKDASAAEPASGSAPAAFAVTLSHAYTHPVTVDYSTADDAGGANPATAGTDYTATSGTLTFSPGQTVQTVSVPVLADADATETNETFLVNLSNNSANSSVADAQGLGTITPNGAPGSVIISELRTSGPAGADDEFVELYNNTDSPVTVAASDASAGWSVVKSGNSCSDTPVVVAVVPNGTVIPARGNYLVVGSGYSLGAYAAGDQSLVFDIEDDRSVALFSTADLSNVSTGARLDAVGFGANAGGNCDLLREGSTLAPAQGSTAEYSFVRKVEKGETQDSNANAADFLVVSTTGGAVGANATSTLGAPGPENATGARGPVPCNVEGAEARFGRSRLDSTAAVGSAPNTVRDATADPGNNSASGTIDFRRRFTNNTGGAVTRLRFRITNTKSPSTPGAADLRARTSGTFVLSVNDPATCGGPAPCNVTVVGTTLEQPPAQGSGGGVNSTLAVGSITSATPLLPGASVNLHLLFGVQQAGDYHLSIVVEAETAGQIGQDVWELRGNTENGNHNDGGCNTPPVAAAGADQTIECGGASTSVTLDGSASTDADGDALTYEWREGATVLGTSAVLNTTLAFGPHTVTLRVTDPSGDFGEDSVSVNVVDTTDPLITAPPNVSVTTGPNASSCGAFVSDAALGQATASDGCSAGVTVTRTGVPSGNVFPVGTTVVTYTADDGHGHTRQAFQTVTVADDTPPVITVPANVNVNAPAGSCSVSLNPGTATAADNCGAVNVAGVRGDGKALNAPYPVGTTTINWTATDSHGNTASGTQTVKVNDVTPPLVVLTTNVINLGSPNHQYETLSIADLVASVSDSCDPSVDINDVVISQATSDEPEDAAGNGDGNTLSDIVIAPDCKSLQLRRERAGGGDGRVYTITLKVADSSGNVTTAVRKVFVPQSGPAVDSGVKYTVNGCNP